MSTTIRSQFSSRTRLKSGKYPSSMTQQAKANETNINKIMSRYNATGQMPVALHNSQPRFGDFSNVTDYQTAHNSIAQTNEAFQKLPAKIRNRFQNNPSSLLDFLQNPENNEEAISLGLMAPAPDLDASNEVENPLNNETENTPVNAGDSAS